MANDAIHIGQLDRRIQIMRYSDDQTETGSAVHTPELVKEIWAQVKFMSNYGSGGEELDGQVISLNIRRYVMRYVDIIASSGEQFWIKDLQDTSEFNINHVEQIGRKEYLICKATRRQ